MQTIGTFSSTCVNTKLKFSWQGSQKSCNLKNQDFSVLPEPTWLPGGDGGRSQRRYKFRLVGSTAPSNTFIANKSITIPLGTLDPSSRSPCKRLTHFWLTQIPRESFFFGNWWKLQYFDSSGQPQVSLCHPSVFQFVQSLLFVSSSPQSIKTSSIFSSSKRLVGGKEKGVRIKTFEEKGLKSFLPHSDFSSREEAGGRINGVASGQCTFVSCWCAFLCAPTFVRTNFCVHRPTVHTLLCSHQLLCTHLPCPCCAPTPNMPPVTRKLQWFALLKIVQWYSCIIVSHV